ncbi:MAG TPA: hypothetical protein VH105_15530, partial [Burkholderiales bacterium]|nr:hypothetical protein [Burkholderiales bacterium]
MLKALDGKRTVEDLAGKFPRLDEEDITAWLRELLRMKLIDFAEIPFELPVAKAARPAVAAPKPAAAAAASLDEFDVSAMAANVEEWLKQDTESFKKVAKADLNATIQSAALRSTQAWATLQDSGFFANLAEPLPAAGAAPAPDRAKAALS